MERRDRLILASPHKFNSMDVEAAKSREAERAAEKSQSDVPTRDSDPES